MDLSELIRISGLFNLTPGNVIMILIGGALVYLAIAKKYEPTLLLPMGVEAMLANIPLTGMTEVNGFSASYTTWAHPMGFSRCSSS